MFSSNIKADSRGVIDWSDSNDTSVGKDKAIFIGASSHNVLAGLDVCSTTDIEKSLELVFTLALSI